jgi:peptidoglycan/xylan/chitin deacetylase (PgdA/CDA1 family)
LLLGRKMRDPRINASAVMAKGKLTISIDLELAWGVWDVLTAEQLRLAETAERPICAALIELFDRYQVPATWAIVAALLDEPSARSRPASRACWYAPDIIEQLARAKTAHEIGSHSGRHIYFDSVAASEAQADLEFAREIHRANNLAFDSFVFPRGACAHLEELARVGLRTFSHADVGWTSKAARAGRPVARAANLVDKMLPITPCPTAARQRDGLIELEKSMLLIGRNGLRRLALPGVTRAKFQRGLKRAFETGGIFHFWFHPSNFYYRQHEQLATLAWCLEHAAEEASRGRIEIRTMGSYAAGQAP